MSVPIEVESIANIIKPPIWANGIIVDSSKAPNAILDHASNIIGYPTLSIVSSEIFNVPSSLLIR